MGAIKITPADKYFSLCVREANENRCERCGSTPNKGGLDLSHFHGRGKWSVRHCGLNGTPLCMGCHRYFTSNPMEHSRWQEQRLGEAFPLLNSLAQDLTLGRQMKREAKAVARFFASQWGDMLEQRATGRTGRIPIREYPLVAEAARRISP